MWTREKTILKFLDGINQEIYFRLRESNKFNLCTCLMHTNNLYWHLKKITWIAGLSLDGLLDLILEDEPEGREERNEFRHEIAPDFSSVALFYLLDQRKEVLNEGTIHHSKHESRS